MLKAVLFDFDGTLVTHDMLDVVCGIVGKEKEDIGSFADYIIKDSLFSAISIIEDLCL